MSYIPNPDDVFPNDYGTSCFIKNVISAPNIIVGDYTYYDDPEDPTGFERNNVLFNYPEFGDKLIIGKFCAIAAGTKFIMGPANHRVSSVTTYPFHVFGGIWKERTPPHMSQLPFKGDIVIGNDVWIGRESVILPGFKSATALLWPPVPWSQKMCRHTAWSGEIRPDSSRAALTRSWWNCCCSGSGGTNRPRCWPICFRCCAIRTWKRCERPYKKTQQRRRRRQGNPRPDERRAAAHRPPLPHARPLHLPAACAGSTLDGFPSACYDTSGRAIDRKESCR